ncbi:Hypothetical predicted protein [Mytilus galloprovincialis]|uniref:Uncharacterized protein n=1 Tax=Mytilus galloprovincialis TaxID=29158 RepID=A0A8B6EP99_MYTGA|nr:Hypothetical predicted protein [Mytilus galloprovincialis]
MEKILKNNHAELAPPIKDREELWYLPIFGVYHTKKLSKIRVVFDSSAKYHGICLNDILLKGPDLTNNLVSVLSKFRIGQFAAIADVEQMFFNFEVQENHRNFLRLIWFKDNDIEMPLVEYRMRVHVFGNSIICKLLFTKGGFVAPVILGGRLIMGQALQNASVEWDDPLQEYLINDWQVWKQSLKDLETLEIRRSFTETSLGDCSKCELHIFSDASKDAIASVAYIRTFNYNGHSQLGFVLGKSKLAPNHGHTIPRLELCAAVLATEPASFIQKTLEIRSSSFINALRIFTALRGPVKEFRSDQGTHFIGAINELDITSFNVEDQPIKDSKKMEPYGNLTHHTPPI